MKNTLIEAIAPLLDLPLSSSVNSPQPVPVSFFRFLMGPLLLDTVLILFFLSLQHSRSFSFVQMNSGYISTRYFQCVGRISVSDVGCNYTCVLAGLFFHCLASNRLEDKLDKDLLKINKIKWP